MIKQHHGRAGEVSRSVRALIQAASRPGFGAKPKGDPNAAAGQTLTRAFSLLVEAGRLGGLPPRHHLLKGSCKSGDANEAHTNTLRSQLRLECRSTVPDQAHGFHPRKLLKHVAGGLPL